MEGNIRGQVYLNKPLRSEEFLFEVLKDFYRKAKQKGQIQTSQKFIH